MICKICGANIPDNAPFCSECGAPVAANNQVQQPQQQVQQNPQVAQQQASPYASPQQQVQQASPYAPPQQMQQASPYAPPQQMQQASPYAPPQQVQQASPYAPLQQQMQPQAQIPVQQPQQMSQQQMEQEWMKQQWMKQQQAQQQVQPAISQQNTGVPQQAFRNQLKGVPAQSNVNSNASSENAKKGASRGLIIGIIVFLVLAAVAAVFFIFVLPKLSKGEPKGEYGNEDFEGYVLFDDGVYAVYDDAGTYEFGTYEINGDEITFTSVNGDVDHGRYNKKENTVEYGYIFESKDAKQTFGVDIDKNYVKGLKEKIVSASKEALTIEEVKAEAQEFAAAYYITGNELAEPRTEFAKALAEKLGYSGDNVLSFLVEKKYITVSIVPDSSAQDVEVVIY